MRVALVHDWLVGQRGGENVLLEMARLFPQAPIFTLVHKAGAVHAELERHPIHTSFIQRLPGAPQRFRRYLPLFPAAIEAFELDDFDLVVSTSHCVAKGVRTRARHVAYIHTPMRYIWDQLPQYVPDWPLRSTWTQAARLAAAPLRWWDIASAQRPDLLLANSAYVAERIARYWRREARVLYPPVDVERFVTAPVQPRQHYLVVSALVPYKRDELAVRLCTERSLPLVVVGDGPELGRLRRLAGPTVRFLGALTPAELVDAYARARALLFCGTEDFGIVPVEAMATGCPVIALAEGGLLETVDAEGDEATGIFFSEPSMTALGEAIERFERAGAAAAFPRERLARRAARFSRGRFAERLQQLLA